MSFDIGFLPGQKTYFGYVLRIIENDRRNIDLIYDFETDTFNLITSESGAIISFKITNNDLFRQWNRMQLKFDIAHDRLLFYAAGKRFIKTGFGLKPGSCYKMLFGSNNYNQYQTSDVLPMKIRDIEISEGGILKYSWPLNEKDGTVAHEIIAQNKALVTYPKWVAGQHYKWLKVQSFTINGDASVAFDAVKENLLVVGNDSLYNYSVRTDSLWHNSYNTGKQQLPPGNQSVVSSCDGNLYSFYIDNGFISTYNFKTHDLNRPFAAHPLTNFLHANKFISCTDTSLYVIGGYGHHIYKNSIERYHFKSHALENVKVKGDFFTPRYLAGLGTNAQGDTAYIIGGYGSATGKQILTPTHLNDMMRFTTKDKTFKKLYDFQPKGVDFVFANSLIINSNAKTYFGLVVPDHKYSTALQLVKGFLNKPDYKLIGDTIPYSFIDTHAFADLYFCPSTQRFIAVTLLRMANNTTRVNIYSLLSPPYVDGIKPVNPTAAESYTWYFAAAIILLMVIVSCLFKYRRYFPIQSPSVDQIMLPHQVNEVTSDENTPMIAENKPYQKPDLKNTILLFGDMQIFDASGSPFIKLFSPLLKELFLIILLYSIRWGRGVSTEKLNELFWFDKDPKSARNNRAVNIAKLKSLLDKIGHYQLSNETGYWKLDIDFLLINVDYYNYLKIIQNKKELNKGNIRQLTQITQGRSFLSNIEYEWLDTFKSEISNEVIDTCLLFARNIDKTQDPEFMVDLANLIFYFDPANEDAMVLKCKALFGAGRHSLAKNTYDSFVKEYKSIYGVDFNKEFNSIMD